MAVERPSSQVDRAAIRFLVRNLIRAVGDDPDRPGLRQTPRRVADFWEEFMDYDPGNCDVTFESVETDQMVVVTGIRVWSLCEHHLLPFWCDLSIGYIAKDRVLGLSKFARISQGHAHGLQIQERLVQEIADSISEITGTSDVAVVGRGEHLCMVMRGIKTPGTMVTSIMRGVFRDEPEARSEFMRLAGI